MYSRVSPAPFVPPGVCRGRGWGPTGGSLVSLWNVNQSRWGPEVIGWDQIPPPHPPWLAGCPGEAGTEVSIFSSGGSYGQSFGVSWWGPAVPPRWRGTALPPLDGEHVQGHTHRTGWHMLGKAWKIVLHQSEHTGKVDVQTGELPLNGAYIYKWIQPTNQPTN